MKQPEPNKTLPLLNRIVILVLCSNMLIGMLAMCFVPKFRNDMDIVQGFLFAVFASMAAGGIWVSLTWKNRTRKELDEEAALPLPGQPEISEGSFACRFATVRGPAAIVIDSETGLIHFRNCHVPRKFLAATQPWFSCSISDLQGVHRLRYEGESMTIVTPAGKALILENATDYDLFRERLRELVPRNQPGFSTEHPMIGVAYLAGALAGLFAGVALTPANANDSTMGLYILGGTFLGVGGLHLLVWFGDRRLKIGLTQPLGFGVFGGLIGLMITNQVQRIIGWGNADRALLLVLTGVVAGFAYGCLKQRRETGRPKERD